MDNKILKEAQKTMQKILVQVADICIRNDIKYWIDSGTLLGAVRHKGFIPWDDDIDICILKSDYDKFLEVCRRELPQNLHLQIPGEGGSDWPYIKIRDKNSVGIGQDEEITNRYHQGLFIDVFTMEIYSKHILYFYNFLLKIERTKLDSKKGIFHRLRKEIIIKSRFQKMCVILLGFLKKICRRKIDDKGTVVLYEYLWKIKHKKEEIFPLKKIIFENTVYYAPNKTDEYLKSIYGSEYMTLPPKERRIQHFKQIEIGVKCEFEKMNL